MTDFHAQAPDAVLEELESGRDGLDSDSAAGRLEEVGPNRLPDPSREGPLMRFFKQFNNPLIYVLLGASVITAFLQYWVDTGVILGVVIINTIIGFLQEGKAEKAMESIREMLSLKAHVLRDREWTEIDADELVPGDIVRLDSGDRVPADLRLLEAKNLRIEESALTGESEPAAKQVEPVNADAVIGDRYSVAYSGTMVAAGRGKGVVIATGTQTELGKINKEIEEVETLETPLTRQMKRFSKFLSFIIVGTAILMGLIGRFIKGMGTDEVFLSSIAFAVAAIPEGLPAIITITMALGVRRMAGRNAIVRKLTAVETLGSVTVICSDKTGTLTRNEMAVRDVVTGTGRYEVSGTGYAPEGKIFADDQEVSLQNKKDKKGRKDLHTLVEIMSLCNDTTVREEDGRWKLDGEPTEGALVALAGKAGFDSSGYERIDEIPFESENKFMATLNQVPEGGRRILLKGAPDRLLDMCDSQLGAEDEPKPLDRSFWEEERERLSRQGLRVLAAAARNVPDEKESILKEDLQEKMVFAGMVGIIDPPRPEAIEAIKTCHRAGIRMVMITGDHAGTAAAIGREMGLENMEHGLTGADLEAASDEDLKEMVQKTRIFARTSPEHKLRLVKAFQANRDVVAMTGDGVNDAPSLKRADVGVAMGIKGTEAAREAAKIVLTDDNFNSIGQAIREGRTIYDNLRKAILFILPTNGAEGLIILTAILFGLTMPLTPVQILWVNMVTAVTLALALAFEPSESNIMSRPPREPGAPILGRVMVLHIAFVSFLIGAAALGVFLYGNKNDMPLALARTLALNTLVMGELFYLFNCRYLHETSLSPGRLFSNPAAWISAGVLLGLQGIFIYVPFMRTLFDAATLSPIHWLISLGIGLSIFLIVEGEKVMIRSIGRRRAADDVRKREEIQKIIRAAKSVYNVLGHGLPEPAYSDALEKEFQSRDIPCRREPEVPILYRGSELETEYRADFLCFGSVIVALKFRIDFSREKIAPAANCLRATGYPKALLVDFGGRKLKYKKLIF